MRSLNIPSPKALKLSDSVQNNTLPIDIISDSQKLKQAVFQLILNSCSWINSGVYLIQLPCSKEASQDCVQLVLDKNVFLWPTWLFQGLITHNKKALLYLLVFKWLVNNQPFSKSTECPSI